MSNQKNSELFSEYPDVLNVSDLMEMLNIGKTLAYQLLRENKIPSFRIGHSRKILKSDVLDYIRHQK